MCVLHALNNALQRPAATILEFDKLVKSLANEMGGNNKRICDFYSHKLAKDGHKGMWSITVAEEFLIRHHIQHIWNTKSYDFDHGHYFIQTYIGHDSHAIAIVDGMLLDSLNSHPKLWKDHSSRYIIKTVTKILI